MSLNGMEATGGSYHAQLSRDCAEVLRYSDFFLSSFLFLSSSPLSFLPKTFDQNPRFFGVSSVAVPPWISSEDSADGAGAETPVVPRCSEAGTPACSGGTGGSECAPKSPASLSISDAEGWSGHLSVGCVPVTKYSV